MAALEHRLTRYADVVAALADPALVPVPPPEPGQTPEAAPPGTAAWLRATFARFASGSAHRRRRALAEADLGRLDGIALRRAATRAAAGAAHSAGAPVDARLLAVRSWPRRWGCPIRTRSPRMCRSSQGSTSAVLCPGRRHAFALAAGILDHTRSPRMARGGPSAWEEAA
jgi:hypothetical protein